jgi:S-(hydroxymethyl)glutathione dehydrogenase/alcohol dehydrogenase
MHWKPGRGIEATPAKYLWNGRTVNSGYVTTFNEYAVVSENRLTPIARDFDLELAPLFGCAIPTGFGVIDNDARLRIGESVLVFGAGGVGLNEIQAAAMSSAFPIIAVDVIENKLDEARAFGATHVLNSSICAVADEIIKIMDGGKVDVAIDNTGDPGVIALAYELTKPQGRTILVGVPKKGDNVSLHTLPLHFGKKIAGSHGGDAKPQDDIPRFIRLYEAGRLKLRELVSDRCGFDQINDAIDKMRHGEIKGRCIVRVASDA